MLQVLHGNCSCQELIRVSGIDASAVAYCKARARVPLDVLGYLASILLQQAKKSADSFERWRGHRVLMIDGSSNSMPDTPVLRDAFKLPGGVTPGCGFPVMHTMWLMDFATGLIRSFSWGPWCNHDMRDANLMQGDLEAGDVVLGDRAFGVYVHLACLEANQLYGVFRLYQQTTVCFRKNRRASDQLPKRQRKGKPRSEYVRRLGKHDQVVTYLRPKKCPGYMTPEGFARLPRTLDLRELRYRVSRPGFRVSDVTLVTTLLDAEAYPKDTLAELYHRRWQVGYEVVQRTASAKRRPAASGRPRAISVPRQVIKSR